MTAFIVCFLFAILQTFLLKALMASITSGKKAKSFLFFFIKFVFYGIAIALFMFKFIKYAIPCFLGFACGMPLCAIALFVYHSFIKKN